MRGMALRLQATYCPDGVKLIHREDFPGVPMLGDAEDFPVAPRPITMSGPDWFIYCSARQIKIVRDAVDLSDPLVVRFVNATDDNKRIMFLSRFGVPSGCEPRNWLLDRQRTLRALLGRAGSGNANEARKAKSISLQRAGVALSAAPDGGFVGVTSNLLSYMYAEIAVAADNGARVGRCRRCNDVFLYGTATRRRSSGVYCSAKCRVYSHRSK